MQRNDLLVWIDLEMTSIRDARIDTITEIAIVLTDKDLNTVAEMENMVVHTDREFYASRTWTSDPQLEELIDEAAASIITLEEADERARTFLEEHVTPQSSPLCGNSIHSDRHFMKLQMPRFESYLFYRCIDVSSIKELARRWAPAIYEEAERRKGVKPHRAKADIINSIEELKYYRDNFFKL